MKKPTIINILNKKAGYEYAFIDKYIAGMVLRGSEIKSIRENQVNVNDAFCTFIGGELFVRNMHIGEYKEATYNNHSTKRDRKLLLNKIELRKLYDKLKDKGLTVIPLRLFINDTGLAKLEIALAKGKKEFDKRDDIKRKDIERETQRRFK